jgi:hypothetical protein
MDIYAAFRQKFIERFNRAPRDTEIADLAMAATISFYLDANLSPQQVQSRLQQMLTPGTPLNTFLRNFR